jgi:HECT-domain (ubiquitin-transferase)
MQVELVPGGREVAVTDANKLAYIHRVADFRLNTQLVRITLCTVQTWPGC